MNELSLLIRLALGLILVTSALPKLRDMPAFVRGVEAYRILPLPIARLYAWVLPLVELGTGALMITGWVPLVSASLAALMLVSFAIALSVNAARGRVLNCHCWGAAETSRIGWHSLMRDVVLLLPALWLLYVDLSGFVFVLPGPASLIPVIGSAALVALAYALLVLGVDLWAEMAR